MAKAGTTPRPIRIYADGMYSTNSIIEVWDFITHALSTPDCVLGVATLLISCKCLTVNLHKTGLLPSPLLSKFSFRFNRDKMVTVFQIYGKFLLVGYKSQWYTD